MFWKKLSKKLFRRLYRITELFKFLRFSKKTSNDLCSP